MTYSPSNLSKTLQDFNVASMTYWRKTLIDLPSILGDCALCLNVPGSRCHSWFQRWVALTWFFCFLFIFMSRNDSYISLRYVKVVLDWIYAFPIPSCYVKSLTLGSLLARYGFCPMPLNMAHHYRWQRSRVIPKFGRYQTANPMSVNEIHYFTFLEFWRIPHSVTWC